MKRVLSLVLALVLVLGMIPTFAAEKTGGEELKALGLLSGNENGDLMEDQTLERQEFAKIIAQLNGALDEAAAYVTPGTFADFDKVEGWAKPYVAYAEEQGWMTGKTGNIFDPEAELKSQELLTVLLRVLGYDDTWSKVFETAAEVGLVAEEITAITRGDAFELIWTAVSEVKMADSDMTLGVHLGVLEPAKPVVTDLVVEDVVADNLKTMVVTFNQPVDEDTVTATTVKLMKGTTNVVASRLLSEDGLSLTIVYTTGVVPQSTELKLTVNGVKNVDGSKELKAYEKTVVVTDVTIPAVKGVSAINAKQLEVFFSEPINFSAATYTVINDLKVDDVAAIAKATPNYLNNSIVFELSTILKPGTHKVEVKNMLDFAAYKALTFTADVTVVEDKTAPVITSAVVKNVNTIEVTFNEPLSAQGSFWVNNAPVTATVVSTSNNTKYTLTGFTLDLSAIVQIKVEYQNQEDVVANKVATKTAFIFKTEDDTTLPTVAVAVGAGNKLTLTFSKSMNTAVGTIKVTDKDKVVVADVNVSSFAASKWSENNTVLTLLGTDLNLNNKNAAEFTLNIKSMEDATVRKNLLAEVTLLIAGVDTKIPEVTPKYLVTNGTSTTNVGSDDTITFYFTEAMDVDTLKNLSNYVYGGTAISAVTGTSVKSVAADAKSIVITYPLARNLTNAFTVYAVKDAAGNMIAPTSVTLLSSTDKAIQVLNTVVSSSADKVVVEFANQMSYVDPSFIKVQENGVDYAVPVSVTLNAAGTKATFTLNKAMATTTGAYRVVQNNVTLAENVYGASYASTATFIFSILDNVRPTAVAAASATPGHIKITFSEQMTVVGADGATKAANLGADLLLRDEDGVLIPTPSITFYLNGTVSTINAFDMIAVTGLTSGDSYSVELISRYVVDSAQANKVIGFSAASFVVK